MKETKLYTSGELAKISGVTIRTIRYYDTKGILKPSYRNNSGHRLYSENDFMKLKKILALKYLGLSLDEIIKIELNNFKKSEIINSLNLQKDILQNKINHMKMILDTIEIAERSMEDDENLDWDKIVDIINSKKDKYD